MFKKKPFIKINSVGAKGGLDFARKEPKTIIQNVYKLWHLYFKKLIPDAIVSGHSDYTKFIIMGKARTGSNFLRGSLMSHHHIMIFGDILRKRDTIHWGIPYYFQSSGMLSLFQNDPVKFFETEVFGKFPKRIMAVGLKMLYPQAFSQTWREPAVRYLKETKDLKVIHIKRKNSLKTYLSLRRVNNRTDRWVNISGKQEEDNYRSIHIDYEECLRAFTNMQELEQQYDLLFEDHQKIDVYYEDVLRNYEKQMNYIQEFLGVDYQPVKPLTHKQAHQPLSQEIANYFELKEKFTGTPWESFFEN